MLNWCLPWEGTNKSSHSIHIILDSCPPSRNLLSATKLQSFKGPEILNSALKLSEIRFNCKASVPDSVNKLRIRFMHELVLSLLIFFVAKKSYFVWNRYLFYALKSPFVYVTSSDMPRSQISRNDAIFTQKARFDFLLISIYSYVPKERLAQIGLYSGNLSIWYSHFFARG